MACGATLGGDVSRLDRRFAISCHYPFARPPRATAQSNILPLDITSLLFLAQVEFISRSVGRGGFATVPSTAPTAKSKKESIFVACEHSPCPPPHSYQGRLCFHPSRGEIREHQRSRAQLRTASVRGATAELNPNPAAPCPAPLSHSSLTISSEYFRRDASGNVRRRALRRDSPALPKVKSRCVPNVAADRSATVTQDESSDLTLLVIAGTCGGNPS